MGLWAAYAQRKSDERQAHWEERQLERTRTCRLTPMDRWAAHEQRRSDERQARWEEERRERARTGRMTLMDRWAASAQRKSDRLLAESKALYRLRPQVPDGPVQGPGDSAVVIRVDMTGFRWLWWWRGPGPAASPGGAGGWVAIALLICLLVTLAIWRLLFHGTWSVYVRTNDRPPRKLQVRLPDEVAAYRAAAQLVKRFQADGPSALESDWTGVSPSLSANLPR